MFDIQSFVTAFSPLLILKLAILLLLIGYMLFSLIILIQSRGFNRVMYVGDSFGSVFMQVLAFLHLLFSIALFFLALAIL